MPRDALQTIHALLSTHTAADGSETRSLERIRQLIETADRPFARDHYVPGHLTASAIVVDAERQNTLLIFHQKLQLWLQPGGHFEPGENDPSVAAAREVLEETQTETQWPDGKPLLLDVDVHVIPARKTEPQHEHFDLRMLLVATHDGARAGDGVTQARWFGRDEWTAMNLDPGLQRALRKVFR
jgi:8-oxo-dGTP pyrophosphatase MutT (NUDIX family)